MSTTEGTYCVKGSSIKSKLHFVKERFGAEAERALKAGLSANGHFLILDSDWYPYKVFDDLCIAIADNHFGGDLERLFEVGEFSAEQTLRSVYEAFVEGGDFLRFLSRIAALHGRFYNEGRMDVAVSPGGNACEIELRGAPQYSEADIQIAAGFYVGAARTCGLHRVRHEVRRRPDGVDFTLRWQ